MPNLEMRVNMECWNDRFQRKFLTSLLCICIFVFFGFNCHLFSRKQTIATNSIINITKWTHPPTTTLGQTVPVTAIPYRFYKWPPDIDVGKAVTNVRKGVKVKPYNNWRFDFLIEPKNRTLADVVPVLRVCVKSKAEHVELRKAMRDTWGREDVLHQSPEWKFRLRTIFLLGKAQNWTELIREEADTHGDILQGDFKEHYRNNTKKMLMGFHYLTHGNFQFDLAFFVDDDYFVSWPNVLQLLSEVKRKLKHFSDLYLGYRWDASPFRDHSAKHFISVKDYPFDRYPPFIAAGAYFMSKESLSKFYWGSYFVKPFKMDDVYLGMIAKALNITPVHSDRFDWQDLVQKDNRNFNHLAAAHGFTDPSKIIKFYNNFTNV